MRRSIMKNIIYLQQQLSVEKLEFSIIEAELCVKRGDSVEINSHNEHQLIKELMEFI